MVVAGGAPGMLFPARFGGAARAKQSPLALAHRPLMWLLLHAAVLAALADRAGGWLAVLRRVPGLGLYLACVNAVAFLAFLPPTRPGRRWAVFASGRRRC